MKDKGFTLIEVMIALVVLLIGMLGVMGMQYYAVSGNTSSREMRMAINQSIDVIEQAKSTPYANLASGSDMPVSGSAISGGTVYTRTWWVLSDCISLTLGGDDNTCNAGFALACTNDPDPANIVAVSAIKARTCWKDKTGADHSVTLDTVRWNENVTP